MNPMRSYFSGGGGSPMPGPFGNMMDAMNKFRQFMQNPMGAMMSSGMNIPQNIQNNPDAIVNYLRSSGQMSEEQYQQLSQMASQFQNFMPKRS